MRAMQDVLTLLGRLLLAALFLPSGWGKIAGFAGTAGYIGSKGLPMPEVLAGAAIAVEVLASVMLIVGWRTRWAAFALAVFTVVAAIFFHDFWNLPVDKQMMQQILFMKNVCVVGGLLVLTAWGAGSFSLDGGRGRY